MDNKKNFVKNRLNRGTLYGITSRKYFNCHLDSAVALINSGIELIQYREKEFSFQEMLDEVREIKKLTTRKGVILLINDHVELCLEAACDGVHLGDEDMPVLHARKRLGANAVIGLSTHNPGQGLAALETSADYIGIGPMFPSANKKQYPVAGSAYAEFAAKNLPLAKVAIGGINRENLSLLLQKGIRSVCMIDGLYRSADLKEEVKKVQELIGLA
ncbi:MAG: thiamine phosphate synthase [Deltaproteobacteria bacterium]|nr:thiamine phosphate synthase [Deltaproteobacteria bacterium]